MTTGELLISDRIANPAAKTSLRSAALIAGLGLLLMVVAAPFAELFVFPKLVVPGDAVGTTHNIIANQTLFAAAIFGYLITFLCDLVVAWALYIFLKPVHENLSLLAAWFRLVYTVIAIVALLNLVTILRALNTSDVLTGLPGDAFSAQVLLSIDAFRSNWYFGLLFFAVHLGLLGYLVIRSTYIPKILGIFLMLAGLGYLLTNLKPFLFPTTNLDFAEYTFYGELIFMLWLLIKGPKIQEQN